MTRVGGLLLAAGASRRYGTPKQLALLRGRPLLQHTVDAMVATPGLDRRVVVLGANADVIRPQIDLRATETITCRGWAEGMSASLRAGIAALGDVDWVVITLGDQPLVNARTIRAVVEAAAAARPGMPVVRTRYGGRVGHPVAIHRSLFSRVGDLRGDGGARHILNRVRWMSVDAAGRATDADVNSPADLAALESGPLRGRIGPDLGAHGRSG